MIQGRSVQTIPSERSFDKANPIHLKLKKMKRTLLIAALATFVTLNGFGQFSFGVAPGLATNSAWFGYKAGKAVPYLALQVAGGSFEYNYTDHYYDGTNWITDVNNRTANVNLLMPTLGLKFFAIETGDLKAYFNLAGSKPMIMGKMKEDGTEVEDFREGLDKIKLLGGEFGFGVEYFLSNNFSIGGEYALRYIGGNHTDVNEYVWHGETSTETTKYTARFFPTIAKFTLNYYFGGGGN